MGYNKNLPNLDAEMLEGNELLTASRPTVLSDFMIVSEDTGHVYAVLEQTPSQQPTTIAQSNETASTEQTEQTHLMETAPNNEFQYVANQTMGLKSRSATWASGQQSNMGSKPACKNLELVQIHDNMTSGSEMEGGTVTDRDRDNGPSHPGNHRKHSLPTNLGEHQRSIVNATQDRPTSNGPKKKPDEPIYSQPDMNKKREERRKKGEQKEQEERTAASRKVSFSNSSCPPLSQATELERREVERRKLENEPSIGSAAVDGPQQTDTSLFGKQLNNNPDDKLLTGKDERLYDEPISLNVFPKKSKSITEKEEGGKENFKEE